MQVAFVATVQEGGKVEGVLLGRTDFDSNPFTQPALAALQSILAEGGDGFILDENGTVLYQANPGEGALLGEPYGAIGLEMRRGSLRPFAARYTPICLLSAGGG